MEDVHIEAVMRGMNHSLFYLKTGAFDLFFGVYGSVIRTRGFVEHDSCDPRTPSLEKKSTAPLGKRTLPLVVGGCGDACTNGKEAFVKICRL